LDRWAKDLKKFVGRYTKKDNKNHNWTFLLEADESPLEISAIDSAKNTKMTWL
jgi:hypothetical protein